jgi:hypothetical protein
VDRTRAAGGRSTVDSRPGQGGALTGERLAGAAEHGILTEGFVVGRFDSKARPVAVKGERW